MKNVKKNVTALVIGSMFLTTTDPQNLHATVMQDHKAELKITNQSIEDAFNKFRYEIAVEWDQKDPYFKAQAEKELRESLESLKSQGVTAKEILDYTQANITDVKARQDFDRLLKALSSQNLTADQASKVAMKYMEKNYQEGVGFSAGGSRSNRKIMIIVGIVIIGVVTYMIIKNHKHHDE